MEAKHYDLIQLLLSLVGIVDSFTLVNEFYNPSGSCPGYQTLIFGVPLDCGGVARSVYSNIGGIPIALFGFLYYLSVFMILFFSDKVTELLHAKYPKYRSQHLILIIVSLAATYSLYLVILQFFIIKLICSYCMFSAISTFLLFTVSIIRIKTGM